MEFNKDFSSKVTIVLLMLIALCLGAATYLFVRPEAQQRVPRLNVNVLPDVEDVAAESVSQALARPLFWETRRPLATVGEGAQAELIGDAPEGVRLLGIIVQELESAALMEVDGRVKSVLPGDMVKQWKLTDISAKAVVLSAAGKTARLSMVKMKPEGIALEKAVERTGSE